MMKGSDPVIRVGESLIQHGHHNDRIYLMRLDPEDTVQILCWIESTLAEEGYTKVFAKVPSESAPAFLSKGFIIEAEIPGYFPDGSACLFLGKYTIRARKSYNASRVAEIRRLAEERAGEGHPPLMKGYSIREAPVSDADALAGIYASVFPSYPFPIDDPDFISDAIADGKTRFFLLCEGDRLIAASSAELDPLSKTVEMTDFATLPSARGTGAAGALLDHMERVVRDEGYHLAYTICRAEEPPVNILFARGGYRYAGTLPNNTQISGGFESMNVWYRRLLRAHSSY
jgi:putative beta-lysine N-acetyltransferase